MKRVMALTKLDNTHLSLIGNNFINDYLTLYVDQEDYQAPFYFLKSNYINDAEDEKTAWLIGQYFIRIINGACNLINPLKIEDYESHLDISNMFEINGNIETNKTPQIPRRTAIINPIKGKLTLNVAEFKAVGSDVREQLLYLVFFREDFKNLVLIAGGELNWIVLYAILETIKFYGGKNFEKKLGNYGITKASIKLFTQTANTFGVLSFNSRHGVNSNPANFEPMEYLVAKELILKISNIFIDEEIKKITV